MYIRQLLILLLYSVCTYIGLYYTVEYCTVHCTKHMYSTQIDDTSTLHFQPAFLVFKCVTCCSILVKLYFTCVYIYVEYMSCTPVPLCCVSGTAGTEEVSVDPQVPRPLQADRSKVYSSGVDPEYIYLQYAAFSKYIRRKNFRKLFQPFLFPVVEVCMRKASILESFILKLSLAYYKYEVFKSRVKLRILSHFCRIRMRIHRSGLEKTDLKADPDPTYKLYFYFEKNVQHFLTWT